MHSYLRTARGKFPGTGATGKPRVERGVKPTSEAKVVGVVNEITGTMADLLDTLEKPVVSMDDVERLLLHHALDSLEVGKPTRLSMDSLKALATIMAFRSQGPSGGDASLLALLEGKGQGVGAPPPEGEGEPGAAAVDAEGESP